MSSFSQISKLPEYDLYNELLRLQHEQKIKWNGGQVCLNTIPGNESDYFLGTGSLFYDWDNSFKEIDENGLEKIIVPERKHSLKEEDFTVLCDVFKNSLFEHVYNEIKKHYTVGRVRLMKSKPKTCLTWHVDDTDRIHYPIKTQDGCFMVIGSEVKHLSLNNWWYTKTQILHTAFNASNEERIHLVATILKNENGI